MQIRIVSIVQSIAFNLYYVANKSGILKLPFFESIFTEMYFFYKLRIENGSLSYLGRYIRSDATVIDVGANIGWFTYEISKLLNHNGRVIAVEPDERNLIRLHRVLSRKRIKPLVEVLSCGLSDRENSGYLILDERNPANHKVTETSDQDIEIDLKTLDQITMNVPKIDLIKIDVQGYELKVLKGSTNTLSRYRPILLIEIDNRFSTDQSELVLKFVTEFKYSFSTTSGEVMTLEDLLGKKGYFDVLCLPTNNKNFQI